MRAMNAVIDKLDIRRAQVQVEAIIVEVAADKTSDLGVNWVLDGSNSKLAVGGFIEPIGGSSIIDLYKASKGTSTNTAGAHRTTGGPGAEHDTRGKVRATTRVPPRESAAHSQV